MLHSFQAGDLCHNNKDGYSQQKISNHDRNADLFLGDFTPHDAEVPRHRFSTSAVSYTICTCTLYLLTSMTIHFIQNVQLYIHHMHTHNHFMALLDFVQNCLVVNVIAYRTCFVIII